MQDIIKWISSPRILISLTIVVSAIVGWLCIRKGFRIYLQNNRDERSPAKQSTLARGIFDAVKYLLLIGTFLAVLQINGVNVGSMVAGLGLMSAIVGLALQDILKDAIMGIHMIADHFFEVGDVVRYRDFEGVVISFNMKTTKLQSIYDHSIMTICNRNISEIVKLDTWTDIDLSLSYKEDPAKVHMVLESICEQIRKAERVDDCIYKGTQEFGQTATVYKIRLFCPPELKPDLRRTALMIIQERLKEARIEIPYPQLDIHHKTGE